MENEDIITNDFYELLDVGNFLVGGSYALKLYAGAKWEANDIDIFVFCGVKNKGFYNLYDEFEKIVNKVLVKCDRIKIIKDFRDSNLLFEDHEEDEANMGGEHFNEQIVGTITIKYPNIDKNIQFVGIYSEKIETFNDVLEKITDLPSCVSYISINDKKTFFVPKKYDEMIKKGYIEKSEICSKRLQKYEKRGYIFIEHKKQQEQFWTKRDIMNILAIIICVSVLIKSLNIF